MFLQIGYPTSHTDQSQAGQNKIQVSGLSSAIDTESVRISGLDEARLFDVVCTVDKKQDNDLSADHPYEVIRLLNTKKRAFESQKRVLEHQADLLVSYAKTLTCEHVDPSAMHDFLQGFETRGNENLEAVSQIDEKIVQINRQIAQETAKIALKTGEANAQVTVVVVSTADMNVDMKLAYSKDPTFLLFVRAQTQKLHDSRPWCCLAPQLRAPRYHRKRKAFELSLAALSRTYNSEHG